MEKPLQTSTPNITSYIKCRRKIGDLTIEEKFSPILIKEVDETGSEDDSVDKILPEKNDTKADTLEFHHGKVLILYTGLILLIISLLFAFWSRTSVEDTNMLVPKIEKLQKLFPFQHKDLWAIIDSSVSNVLLFHGVSVIMFVYTEKSNEYLHPLLANISNYAECHLNICGNNLININGEHLNENRFIGEYGEALHYFGNILENQKVLLINDIDKVNGTVAQAFHTLCDEDNPLMKNAMILFTIKKRNTLIGSLSSQVYKILRKQWHNLDGDIFAPLLARITNLVVEI